jgi:hypothetical protein
MKKSVTSKTVVGDAQAKKQIAAYSKSQSSEFSAMCEKLRVLIDAAMPSATSKLWHGSPVWFIDDNPVVGYNAAAKSVNMLFWNGIALGEDALQPVGKYRAAQAIFVDADEIDSRTVRRWLKKAKSNIFDSKAFFKKRREKT